jgi:hypothetical protein
MSQPLAVLLLFPPGKSLRTLKYYLFPGVNTLSSLPQATVSLAEAGPQSAVIRLENQLVTIRDTSANPWLQKTASLPPFRRVLLEPGREF